jgi:hypothetical protein
MNARVRPEEARLAVANAVKLLEDEIDRLRGLQRAAARREGSERELRAENARLIADARRRDAAHEALRELNVTVSKQWLDSLVSTLCDALQSERRAAMERRDQRRADTIAGQIDQVVGDYNRVLERGRQ